MEKYLFLFFILILASFQVKSQSKSKHILVVHNGAGNISKEQLCSDLEKAYITKLEKALKAGSLVLEKGGSAIDARQGNHKLLYSASWHN